MNNLAVALARGGKSEEALGLYRRLIELDPGNAAVRLNFGMGLARSGKLEEAAVHLEEAARLRPDLAQARYSLSLVLARQGKTPDALKLMCELMGLPAGSPGAEERLAWALATSSESSLRDGALAIRLAQRACEASQYANPASLDVLAAAYAEVGRFREAAETAKKALDKATADGKDDLAGRIRARIQLYEAERPYRE